MRQVIINGFCGGIMGWMMSSVGYGIDTWQFWLSFLVCCIIIINSMVKE